MTDINRLNFAKRTLLYLFLSVPIISATISAFHLEGFMRLGNPTFLSVTTAIAYEIANVTAMFIFVMLPRINRSFVWISFIMLVVMQVVGNVFFSYDYIIRNVNPEHLSSWYSMTNYLFDSSNKIESSFYLACFIGIPVPLVAIFLTKSVSNYLGGEEIEEKKTEIEEITNQENPIIFEQENVGYVKSEMNTEITNKLPTYTYVDDNNSLPTEETSVIHTENERLHPKSAFEEAVDNLFKEENATYSPEELGKLYDKDINVIQIDDHTKEEIIVGQDTLIVSETIEETKKEESINTSDFNDKLEQRGLIIK